MPLMPRAQWIRRKNCSGCKRENTLSGRRRSLIRHPLVDRGVYQLHIYLPRATTMEVGRLGTFRFPAGWYVYTGSAMNGLEARVQRHRRREKKLKWHVDHLLQHALVRSVVTVPTTERIECAWNERTLAQPGARVVAKRFGSSDCRCTSHLIYFGRRKPPVISAETHEELMQIPHSSP